MEQVCAPISTVDFKSANVHTKEGFTVTGVKDRLRQIQFWSWGIIGQRLPKGGRS